MVNKVILVGNLCQDPDIRYTQSGTAVATLNIATNRKWKDGDGNKQEEAEFHRVIVWNQTAEFCGNFLTKGMKVYAEGRLQTRKWQDQGGNDRYTTEIIAQTIQNLSPKGGEGGGHGEPPMPNESSYGGTGADIPF